MPVRSKVFIASSSEGLDVVNAVRQLLQARLAPFADIEPWTLAFELSATYIESLEKIADEVDFAILVLTPDDVTTSRKKASLSPRDNVIFELGLFMGALGRERCYLVQEDRPDLKLPTDLLGIHSASFKRPADNDLRAALEAKCGLVAERIAELGSRHKLSPEARATQAANRAFIERVKGAWWERITIDGTHHLSFLQLDADESGDAVVLQGISYDAQGTLMANWNSLVARVVENERKILYHWQGWFPESPFAKPQDRFSGFGEVEFELPREPGQPITRGIGRFWDVDENRPEKTVVKTIRLHRTDNGGDIATMTEGKEKDRRAVVVRILEDW
ncbi:MAG: hypothetical protein H6R14_1711 [Proteobacteria bacterium]|nr:hypothetical protein [Pseudomonadota bacterium]